MALPLELLVAAGSLLGAVGAGGAAWGGSKVALNGTRQRVRELVESHASLNSKMDAHVANDATVQLELATQGARTEAKVDILLDRVK